MSIDSGASADFQRSTRMPLDAVVRLHFEGTVAYQNGFAANVSATGAFVKHPDPPPIGTRLVFEFAIGSQRKPVQGAGEVAWVREKYEGPGRPAGAGIRFAELDELSRQNLTEALFEFLEASLGDRIAENPEARALVASRPTHAAPADLALEPEPAPALVAAPGPAAFGAAARASAALEERDGSDGTTPFRIFDDDAPHVELVAPAEAPGPPAVWAPPPAVPAVPATPAAWTPAPPPPDAGGAVAWAGAAAAREESSGARRWLLPALTAAALAAAATGAWWLWLRPAAAPPPPPAAEATAPAPAPKPATPPLGARLDPGRTLADAVAPAARAPGTPLPAGAVPPEDDAALRAATREEAPPVSAQPAPGAAPGTPAAAAASAPAPAEVPAAAPPAARATAVTGIAAATEPGTTRVTVSGDGTFETGAFAWSEIGGDKPRVLIKLRGMAQAFRGTARGVPTPEVQGVRTGFHPGAEIHVVVDLVPGARVAVESVEPTGDGLVVTLRRR